MQLPGIEPGFKPWEGFVLTDTPKLRIIIKNNKIYIYLLFKKMMARKKEEINLDALNFKVILEEAVACSRLGRPIASLGAMLTGREKQDAKLVYLMLKAEKELPKKTPATAYISEEKKSKKFGYEKAVKWFAENYPKEAEPLLAKLKENYDETETSVVYGVEKNKDLPDNYYIDVLVNILGIPKQDAAVMYHGVLRPYLNRMSEEEGLVKLVMR